MAPAEKALVVLVRVVTVKGPPGWMVEMAPICQPPMMWEAKPEVAQRRPLPKGRSQTVELTQRWTMSMDRGPLSRLRL